VTGGSQGAQFLNHVVPPALISLRRRLQIVHLSGGGADAAVRVAYRDGEAHGLHAVVRPLATDMAELYAAADLVICRGGGGTVAELMAAGRAAIVVPYPHHRDRQQFHNAMVLVRAGAAELVEQRGLTAPLLAARVGALLVDGRAALMGARAARAALPDPTARIVADIRSFAPDLAPEARN
jgi:UDP-N-acetylglucosamine--N-acetylmuramyl-(pentapeptide) pyrophosphoryl-undecaprenol N-acetylglucosamine transferase